MKTTTDPAFKSTEILQETVLQLQQEVACLVKERDELREANQYLLEQFRLAQHKQFGKSSEADSGQGDLFNEAEQLVDETAEPEKESINYTRNKPKRAPLPRDLPRDVVIHDLDDDEKVCDCWAMIYSQWVKRKVSNSNLFLLRSP